MKDKLSEEKKEEIIKKLGSKKFKAVCPMCGNKKFTLVDGYFSHPIQSDLKRLSLGGSSIPTVPIICLQCGFVSQHALGVLELLAKEEKDGKEKK